MKHTFIFLLCSLLVLLSTGPAYAGRKETKNLELATFNIRYGTPKDTGVRSWDARRSSCIACVRDNDFDVVGFQEVLAHQQEDLKRLLPEYEFEFVGRNDGTSGEAVGIGYKKDRVKALESGRFWLSPTPDTPSNSVEWGGPQRNRVAVWIKFEDLKTGKKFYYLSTHMEVGREQAGVRSHSADLVISREMEINREGLPFFVVGDLNPAGQTEEMLLKFRAHFQDTFHLADKLGCRFGPVGTYNGFNPDADLSSEGKKGDYIFGKGKFRLYRYEALTDKYDGQYPSDHLAVSVTVRL